MNKKEQALSLTLCLVFAVAYLFFVSVTTSPFWGIFDSQDSYVYLLIGKYWTMGKLPYVDLWDQKGPIIYLINAIGYAMTQSRLGVFCLQIPFMAITLFWVYKIFRTCFNWLWSIIGTFCFVLSLSSLYDGNMVEEYLLPFLAISLYFQYQWVLRYSVQDVPKHKPRYAFVYGLTFAFCLLTRLTNALGICGGVMVITLVLLYKHAYRNLLQNIVAFICGFAILAIPIFLYFYAHGALGDMWYGTIEYNLHYATNTGKGLFGGFGNTFIRTYIDVYSCLAIGFLLLWYKNRRMIGLWMISISCGLLLWLISSFGYGHYGMFGTIYLAIVMLELYQLVMHVPTLKTKIACSVLICFYAVMVLTKDFATSKVLIGFNRAGGEENVDKLMKLVPQEDYNKFIAIDASPYCYLQYDIHPCYKYFTCQTFTMAASKEHTARVLKEFNRLEAKWILVDKKNTTNEGVDFILCHYYDKIATSGNFEMYKNAQKEY